MDKDTSNKPKSGLFKPNMSFKSFKDGMNATINRSEELKRMQVIGNIHDIIKQDIHNPSPLSTMNMSREVTKIGTILFEDMKINEDIRKSELGGKGLSKFLEFKLDENDQEECTSIDVTSMSGSQISVSKKDEDDQSIGSTSQTSPASRPLSEATTSSTTNTAVMETKIIGKNSMNNTNTFTPVTPLIGASITTTPTTATVSNDQETINKIEGGIAEEEKQIEEVEDGDAEVESGSGIATSLPSSSPAKKKSKSKKDAAREKLESLRAKKVADNALIFGEDASILPGTLPKGNISRNEIQKLYESIRGEIRDQGYDEFTPTWGLERDFTDATTSLARTLHPTDRVKTPPPYGQLPRNSKFEDYLDKNAAYWRRWKYDTDILEEVSAKKIIKKIQHDQRVLDGKGKLRLLKYPDGREMSEKDQNKVRKLAEKYKPMLTLGEVQDLFNKDSRVAVRYPIADQPSTKGTVKLGRVITKEEKNRPSMIAPYFDMKQVEDHYATPDYYFSEGGLGYKIPNDVKVMCKPDPNSVGGAASRNKGLSFASSGSRGDHKPSDTATCDMPTGLGDFLQKSQGHVFSSSSRFGNSFSNAEDGSPMKYKNMGESTSKDMLDIPGPKFPQDDRKGVGGSSAPEEMEIEVEVLPQTEIQRMEQEQRKTMGLPPLTTSMKISTKEDPHSAPGPGTYNLLRFGDVSNYGSVQAKKRPDPGDVLMKLRRQEYVHPGLKNDDRVTMSGKVVFGYGCNLHEHVMYGMCLDGMCGRRAPHEHTILVTDDELRMTGNMGLKSSLQMLEETPDELRAKKLEEQREKVEAVKAQLGGTLELMKKNKPKRDDGLEGHRQMALLRELEGDEEEATGPGMLPPREIEIDGMDEKQLELIKRVKARREFKSLTPLHIASHRQDLKAIAELGELGYDINDSDAKSGQTALHIAAKRNNVEAIARLLEIFGPELDVNKRDVNGDTPLHITCRSGFDECTAILCDAGADPMLSRNVSGRYPYEEARSHFAFQTLKTAKETLVLKDAMEEIKEEGALMRRQIARKENIFGQDASDLAAQLQTLTGMTAGNGGTTTFGSLPPIAETKSTASTDTNSSTNTNTNTTNGVDIGLRIVSDAEISGYSLVNDSKMKIARSNGDNIDSSSSHNDHDCDHDHEDQYDDAKNRSNTSSVNSNSAGVSIFASNFKVRTHMKFTSSKSKASIEAAIKEKEREKEEKKKKKSTTSNSKSSILVNHKKKHYDKVVMNEPTCGPKWVSGQVRRSRETWKPEDDYKNNEADIKRMTKKWGGKFRVDMHVFEGEAEVSSYKGPIGPLSGGAKIGKVRKKHSSYTIGRYDDSEG